MFHFYRWTIHLGIYGSFFRFVQLVRIRAQHWAVFSKAVPTNITTHVQWSPVRNSDVIFDSCVLCNRKRCSRVLCNRKRWFSHCGFEISTPVCQTACWQLLLCRHFINMFQLVVRYAYNQQSANRSAEINLRICPSMRVRKYVLCNCSSETSHRGNILKQWNLCWFRKCIKLVHFIHFCIQQKMSM